MSRVVTGPRRSAVARALHSAAALPFVEGSAVDQSLAAAALVLVLGLLVVLRGPFRLWLAPRPLRSRVAAAAAVAVLVISVAGAAGAVGTAGELGAAYATPASVAQSAPRLQEADSFPHARHTTVACLRCHETGAGHGRLRFERPRGCAECHHQTPTPDTCGKCHRPEQYGTPKPATLTITVPNRAPNPRSVEFLHAPHVTRSCVECHTTPVTLAPSPATAQCKECHSDHHAAGPTCANCHRIADPKAAHSSVEITHQRCDACHTPETVAKLTPTRAFCGVCHTSKAQSHQVERECTVCHFLAEPSAYRARLLTPPPR